MRRRLCKSLFACAAFVFGTAMSISGAEAVQTVAQQMSMPVELRGSVTTFDCANAPGPQITFDGSMVLSGVDVQLIFRNNINKDVHVRQEDVQLAGGIAAGEEIVIPKQPSRGGVGGNPFIWIQIVDMNGQPLSNEIFLGRCVQGPVEPIDFVTPVLAQAVSRYWTAPTIPGPSSTSPAPAPSIRA